MSLKLGPGLPGSVSDTNNKQQRRKEIRSHLSRMKHYEGVSVKLGSLRRAIHADGQLFGGMSPEENHWRLFVI